MTDSNTSFRRRTFLRGAMGMGALGMGAMAPFVALDALMREALAADPARFGANADAARAIAIQAHEDLMAYPDLVMHGDEQIAMLVYPQMTMLDLVGPQYFFASMMSAKVHLVSKDPSLAPVMGDTGFAIVPTMTMADCPKDLDILFVPGGTAGTLEAMQDDQTLDYLADYGARTMTGRRRPARVS